MHGAGDVVVDPGRVDEEAVGVQAEINGRNLVHGNAQVFRLKWDIDSQSCSGSFHSLQICTFIISRSHFSRAVFYDCALCNRNVLCVMLHAADFIGD